ncbi:TlpA disulfide reductase family protein [Massilia sp. TS11]|uniref:TlpA family protein disulfide reductase n=1 Tax=Massilia sp. TS11 TaxID=2908003 RepID=UPI001EDC3209|nr:TlpA disulfide reductase family protein [Massilia sp. TS11]MCG2583759.1 TlpA family protein disulfide reductase [Massilia sp. TS11]
MPCVVSRIFLAGAMLAGLSAPALALQPGAAAPNLELAADSGPFQLEAYRGKLVYLDFWASWCGPCKQSFPWMNAMQAKYADKGLVVVAVNVDTARADAERFLKAVPAQFKIAYDPKGQAAQQYAIKGMPSSILIGRDGKVLSVHAGFNPGAREQLERALEAALGGQP